MIGRDPSGTRRPRRRRVFLFCVLLLIASLTVAVESGCVATVIASAYFLGYGVAENHSLATKWFQIGAGQGNSIAAFMLGAAYYNGDGTAADPLAAAFWWRIAAEKGNAGAQAAFGDAYCLGIGVYP